jgi:hypothetical protein
MGRYLITYVTVSDEVKAEFIDSVELGLGEKPLLDALVASYDKQQIHWLYKYSDFYPVYAYRETIRGNPDASYTVYRETDEGHLLYLGTIAKDLLNPRIVDDRVERCPSCGAALE